MGGSILPTKNLVSQHFMRVLWYLPYIYSVDPKSIPNEKNLLRHFYGVYRGNVSTRGGRYEPTHQR